jgi:hypothetical protein
VGIDHLGRLKDMAAFWEFSPKCDSGGVARVGDDSHWVHQDVEDEATGQLSPNMNDINESAIKHALDAEEGQE